MITFRMLATALALFNAPTSVNALNNGVAKLPGAFFIMKEHCLVADLLNTVLGYNSQFIINTMTFILKLLCKAWNAYQVRFPLKP